MTNSTETRAKLELAYHRIRLGRQTKNVPMGTKLSILAVAHEAGVSGTLIHTKYPDIAETIRAQLGKSLVQRRDAKNARIANLQRQARELRKDLSDKDSRIAKLGNENARLVLDNERLRALVIAEPKSATPVFRAHR